MISEFCVLLFAVGVASQRRSTLLAMSPARLHRRCRRVRLPAASALWFAGTPAEGIDVEASPRAHADSMELEVSTLTRAQLLPRASTAAPSLLISIEDAPATTPPHQTLQAFAINDVSSVTCDDNRQVSYQNALINNGPTSTRGHGLRS